MKRIIVLAIAALAATAVLASSPAFGQSGLESAKESEVEFDKERSWFVIVDGAIESVHDEQHQARDAAARMQRENPEAWVGYTRQTMWVARLLDGPPEPTTSTTSPTSTPTTSLPTTSTPNPTTSLPTTSTPNPTTSIQDTSSTTATTGPPTTVGLPSGDLVWGYDDTPPEPGWTKPGLYQPYRDPAYGSTVRRVATAEGTRFNRNTYSRRQAENADGSLFLTYHGSAAYHVYRTATGELVRALPIHPDAEPQWHPTQPNLIRYLAGPNSSQGDLTLHTINVTTGATSTIADLTDRIRRTLPGADYMKDRAEGSPSADGNRYAWFVHDSAEKLIGVVSYDLGTDTVLGTLPVGDMPGAGTIDALSMSPTGKYVVTQAGNGTYVYDADLTNQRLIFRGAEHSDIALGANGEDVYVYIDFTASKTGGWLTAVDLDTLTPRLIFDLYDDANTSIHISGKGYGKPGWIVASTYNCKVLGAWSCDKVMAVELAPNGRVLNLAHTYNCGDNYWTEAHAVVNRDFSRVYFNSDSGSCGIDAEAYRIDVPDFQ